MGLALVGLLVLLLLLFVGGYRFLTSPAGEVLVREKVLEAVRDALAGTVEVREVDFAGRRLILRGLVLRDPEGERVAEIERVEALVALAPLVAQRLVLEQAEIAKPRFYLKHDERGFNLTRALTAKVQRPPKPGEKPLPLTLSIEALTLAEGYVSYLEEPEDEGAAREAVISSLTGKGSGAYSLARGRARVDLTLNGTAERPMRGPLTLTVVGELDRTTGEARVALDAPGLKLDASGKMDGTAQRVELRALELAPQAARAILPGYPLQVSASASGSASRDEQNVKTQLSLRAGSAQVSVDGSLDLARLRTDGLTVRARDINLEELIEKAPPTAMSLDLRARGGGLTPERLEGEVELSVPASRVAGQLVGPVRLSARAGGGQIKVNELLASMPGLQISGSGSGTRHAFQFAGKLGASDLSLLARTLARMGGVEVPDLSGSGSLGFKLSGPITRPALALDGGLASFLYGSYAIKDLTVSAQVPNVRRPLEAQGSLKAALVTLGERHFRDVSATLVTRGRELEADFSARGLADIVVHLGGTIDPDHEGMAVSALSLRYPEAEWTLQRPSRIVFSDARLALEPIVLHSGAQVLALAGEKVGARLSGKLDLDKLDLSLLPKAFVPPELQLAGLLGAHVEAHGTVSQPAVDARLELSGGRIKGFTEVGATLSGRYERGRATGKLAAASPVARVDSDFDVPVQAVLKKRREPLRALVEIHPFEIEQVMHALGRTEPASGKAQAQLVITGTARDPLVRLTVAGRNVRYRDRPPPLIDRPGFDLVVESGPEARLQARMDLEALGSSGVVSLRTPYTAADLMGRMPTVEQLQDAPMELDVYLQEVDARLLRALKVGPEIRGRLSLRAEARGTARAPVVNAELTGVGLSTEDILPTDATVALVAGPERVDAAIDARRAGKPVVQLTAALEAPLGTLYSADALRKAPVRVEGTVGPVAMAELRVAQGDPDDEDARLPEAILSARVSGAGTLGDPKLRLHSTLEEIRVGRSCVGRAEIRYAYEQATNTLKAALTSQGGGRLDVNGEVRLDLSYDGLARGLDVERAPLLMDIAAHRFDTAILTGLIPRVRAISGVLAANARVDETLGSPRLRGDIDWSDGQLALMGYGTYKQVRLKLRVTNERFDLANLSAQSGGGTLKLTADAVRAGDKYSLTGKGALRSFPIVNDDQLRAVVTAEPTIEGEISSKLLEIKHLRVPEAHVELPEIQRKDLQELDRPDDVVLVKNGDPIVRRKKKPEPEPPSGDQSPAGNGGPGSGGAGNQGSTSWRYWVTVDAPRNVWVRGTDVNAEVGLSEGFRFEYEDQSALFGAVRLIRGRVEVLGRKFEVQRDSEARFAGSARRPHVNATAIHTNDREEVTVYITVRGQGTDVALRTTSEPPLSESEIYTLLATGRRTLKRGSGASMTGSDTAASVAGSLLAAQLKKTLASKLPLDVLSIETSEDAKGKTGVQLEVGKYLTDQFYLGYSARAGANPAKENTHTVRAEYQFSPRFSVEADYGDARVGGMDFIWSRDF